MASEAKRGCGYRKVGGIYLVSEKLSAGCDRLPWKLDVCPCCGVGIKPARAWTWVDPVKLFGEHYGCRDVHSCPVCQPAMFFGEKKKVNGETLEPARKAGLLWIGDKFYSPGEFTAEAAMLGVSRRIPAVPRGFEIGLTWVFLAHRDACPTWVLSTIDGSGQTGTIEGKPGIFCAFVPKRIEYIVNQSEYNTYMHLREQFALATDDVEKEKITEWDEWRLQGYVDRGMTLVAVPDNDPDHH